MLQNKNKITKIVLSCCVCKELLSYFKYYKEDNQSCPEKYRSKTPKGKGNIKKQIYRYQTLKDQEGHKPNICMPMLKAHTDSMNRSRHILLCIIYE